MYRNFLSIVLLTLGFWGYAQTQSMSLDGIWEFQIDSLDLGIDHTTNLEDKISLPGTMDLARKGDATSLSLKLQKPQLLHLTRRYSYIGPAWYKRIITIGSEMSNKPLALNLERVLWQSRVWVDGNEIGPSQESLTTPHRYLIPPLSEGEHTLTIRIDNRKRHDISVDNLAHAYTNDTQVMWNGILGDISLSVVPDIGIQNLQIYPNIQTKVLKVSLEIFNNTGKRQMLYSLLRYMNSADFSPSCSVHPTVLSKALVNP